MSRCTPPISSTFGSEASATYTGDTDGGLLGTGRADQAVTYHNTFFKILEIGAQTQFRTTDNDSVVDGAGLSAQLTILPGTKIGASYTTARFDDVTKAAIHGLGGDAEVAAVGTRLDWKRFSAGLVYARQRNGDLVHVPVFVPGGGLEIESISFDADGVEGYARVEFPRVAVYGGFNYYRPDVNDPLINPDFRVRYGIVGADVQLAANTSLYTEARLWDDSVGASGEEGFNVLTVGIHYGFSFKGFHRR
jgi:predicted porin